MARKQSKLNSEECKQSISNFLEKQKKFKKIEGRFSEIKADFYNDMEDYFKQNGIGGKLEFESEEVSGVRKIVVTRIQSSKVEFNPDKLEVALGKELSQGVIQKHYEVIDMNGLVKYLKKYETDPKIFKSFISVHKTVNVKELEKLEELGKITMEQIEGCFTVKSQSPYFTVKIGKGQGNG